MRHSWFQRVAVAGSLIAGGLVLTTSSSASALTCTSGVEGDVNGDGYAEVAVSENGRSTRKGAVHVFYGRPKGLAASASGTALDDQYLDQDEPGVPGTAEDGDFFGSGVLFGDYNGDGCADLAVGASSELIGEDVRGAVYIFFGSKSGLKMTGIQRITSEQVFGPNPDPYPYDQGFGAVMAAGDLNDDGVTDLAMVLPYNRSDRPLAVLYGGSSGLSASQGTVLPSAGGSELAVGDFDGDAVEELAVGFGEQGDGNVQVLEWDGGTFEPTMAAPLTGPSLGFDDRAVADENGYRDHALGQVMAAGDVDADGHDDLAVGMRRVGSGGTVVLVKGSSSGLNATGLETWTQSSPGVVGAGGGDHMFGSALAMGRLNSGTTDDLAIGVPNDEVGGATGAGSVNILLGSSAGLTTAGSGGARYNQDTSGIAGSAEKADLLGHPVAIANVQSKTQGSLVFGVPSEDVGTVRSTGQFHQLSIASTGPKISGSVALNLDSVGVRGASRTSAHFSKALD